METLAELDELDVCDRLLFSDKEDDGESVGCTVTVVVGLAELVRVFCELIDCVICDDIVF